MLSLDICIGALGSGAVAETIWRSRMKQAWWWILPVSVWVIYTADHLFDAWKLRGNAVNERHRFHHDHFAPLAILAACASVGALVGAFWYLRDLVIFGGLVVGALAALHVVIAFWGKLKIGKEFSVALIYTFGVWFAPIINRGIHLNPFSVAAVLVFAIAALQNLIMNSIIESDLDHAEGQAFATAVFPHMALRTFVLGTGLLAIFAVPAVWTIIPDGPAVTEATRFAATFILILTAVPAGILWFQRVPFLRRHYRPFAEWVFALGLVTLYFAE